MVKCWICRKKMQPGSGTFFKVPKDEKRRQQWSEICRTQFTPNAHICIDHFSPTQIIRSSRQPLLLPIAVPIVQTLQENEEAASCNQDGCLFNIEELPKTVTEQETQTDVIYLDIERKEYVERIRKLESENKDLKCKLTEANTVIDSMSKSFTEVNTAIDSMRKLFTENVERTRKLQSEKKGLKCKLNEANMAIDSMRKFFTEGQIRKLMCPGFIHWKWNDISSAICLHAAGPRAYRHMYSKGFPLPDVSTLQRWSRKINLNEGILHTSINFMRNMEEKPVNDKICVLAFDEMKEAETFEYDYTGDVVRKPANNVQVVMVRGLRKSWKQPVFYDYDCSMNKELLHKIICEL